MNIQTKAAIAGLGLIAIGAYLAPFRQQVSYANTCIQYELNRRISDWEERTGNTADAQDIRAATSESYRVCQGLR